MHVAPRELLPRRSRCFAPISMALVASAAASSSLPIASAPRASIAAIVACAREHGPLEHVVVLGSCYVLELLAFYPFRHRQTQERPMVNQAPPPPLVVLTFLKRLVAMNAHTGQRAWEFETGMSHEGRLLVEQGVVLYGWGGDLICLDYLTGALRWKAKLPPSTSQRVLIHAGCVIATGMGETACLNLQNGALIWHEKFKGYGSASGSMAASATARA